MDTNTPKEGAHVILQLHRGKECKGSVRFEAAPEIVDPAFSNIYLSRTLPFVATAKKIRVTVEVVE